MSYQVNVPDGINIMANTSVLAVSIPMTPITLAFGPHVAFYVFLTGGLALTGISWYYVLSRHFVTSKVAAWVGAIFAAFAPSMVAHAQGHPNIISQFLIPLIIWRTLCLKESGRAVRNGVALGLLIVWQAFINLEILFMTAVGVGFFVAIVGLSKAEHRRYFKTFVAGLGVTAVVALTLLATRSTSSSSARRRTTASPSTSATSAPTSRRTGTTRAARSPATTASPCT